MPRRPPPPLDHARAALFADLDGTLAPIRPKPGDVGPDDARARLLADLCEALGGALAVVSGRGLEDIDRILERRVAAVAAVHGLVRRTAGGTLIRAPAADLPAPVRDAVAAFLATHPDLTSEDKTVAVSLHFRAAPRLADACNAFVGRLAAANGLSVQRGEMVVELRAPGPSKADSVTAFMAEQPFAGRLPVFVGDDLTDEDGFAGAERLGGYGVIVGERRPTRAAFALDDVSAALAWLAVGLFPPPKA
jgi:trehalose 6-phosphate phosphatase